MLARRLAISASLPCVVFGMSVCGQTLAPADEVSRNANANENAAGPVHLIVEGQITDAIGGGLQGVSVTLRRKASGDEPGELLGTTSTDGAGDFAIKSEKPVLGELVIEFTKEKHAPIRHEFSLQEGDGPKFFGEQMEGNLTVKGIIKDALTDKPIAGARVSLKAMFSELDDETDETGAFSITGGTPGEASLIVEARGYGRERQPIDMQEDTIEINLSLKPERVLHLKTVDERGQAIGNVIIELYDPPREDFRTLVTGADGTVTVPEIHFDAAVLPLRLSHPDHVSSIGFGHHVATPAASKESTHELVMNRAGRITGRVLDATSRQPIHGARIVSGSQESDQSPRDWSSYEGQYTLVGLAPGEAVLTVHRDGYAPELSTTQVRAGEVTQLDFSLQTPRTITGVVKNDKDETIVGAFVMASKWREHQTLGLRAFTGRDGAFTLENAPVDEFDIIVSARGASEKTVTVPVDFSKPLVVILGHAPPGPAGPLATIKVGDDAPVVTLTTLDGKTVNTADYKGKVVLLDFWATWCAPCVGEIPRLIALHRQYGQRKDFIMISVSLDHDPAALRDFVKKRDLKWLQTHGESAQAAANAYGVQGIPAAFLINADGKIAAMDLSGRETEKKLTELLGASASP